MKIDIDTGDSNTNRIVSYSKNCIELKNKLIKNTLVISSTRLDETMLCANFNDFDLENLKKIISWEPEIILIGSGKTAYLPNPEWIIYANKKNIGLEVMTTGAACRSYNLLVDEGRNAVACLFLPA